MPAIATERFLPMHRPPRDPHAHAQKTAKEFEDVMVRMFVGTLRETTTIGGQSEGMFGAGPGADTFADWFDEKMAHEIAATGKVGIADVLLREFEEAGRPRALPGKAAGATGSGLLDVEAQTLRQRALPHTLGGLDVTA